MSGRTTEAPIRQSGTEFRTADWFRVCGLRMALWAVSLEPLTDTKRKKLEGTIDTLKNERKKVGGFAYLLSYEIGKIEAELGNNESATIQFARAVEEHPVASVDNFPSKLGALMRSLDCLSDGSGNDRLIALARATGSLKVAIHKAPE